MICNLCRITENGRATTQVYDSRGLFYIDLNMVRTGAVDHPLEWKHSAIHELLGQRERYLIVNMKRLLQCLAISSEKQFKTWDLKTLEEKIACISHDREGY